MSQTDTFEDSVDMAGNSFGQFRDAASRQQVIDLLANVRGMTATAGAETIIGRFQGGEFDRYLRDPVAARINHAVLQQKAAARDAAARIGGSDGSHWK
jgi:hypothetical protein